MKTIFKISILVIFLITGTVDANEAIKCFEKAYEHSDNAGFGLTIGQAVELCSGATNANQVIQCFDKAWSHPANDGLGLNAGQAIGLCKTNALSSGVIIVP